MTSGNVILEFSMTMKAVRRTRVGRKGQVVIAKEWREKFGIKAGTIVEQIPRRRGVLITPINPEDLTRELEEAAELIGGRWPKGVSAVQAVREDREK